MIDDILWIVACGVVVLAVGVLAFVIWAAWSGLIDDEHKVRRDDKHRRHHRWTDR